MGQVIEAQGGHVDKFIGDGIMALFGVEQEPEQACRQALAAARAMAFALEQLNRELAHDLPEPLRIAIGLHVGPAILGEMGYGRATSLTAVGDTVNVAARLEALTKEFDVQLVASTRLAERAGIDLGAFEERRIEIRGRRRPLRVRLVGDARALPVEVTPAGRAARRLGPGSPASDGARCGSDDPDRCALLDAATECASSPCRSRLVDLAPRAAASARSSARGRHMS